MRKDNAREGTQVDPKEWSPIRCCHAENLVGQTQVHTNNASESNKTKEFSIRELNQKSSG